MTQPSTTYSLLELNQYIRRVISLNFEEPLWIECEISQASLSRGHWYLDLIQKDGQAIVAQCQAAMWANVYYYLKRKLSISPEEILQQGLAVKLKVNVDYHERYGMKLIIEDIDSSFTIGHLEMQRQAILLEIKRRNLIRKNAEIFLPAAIQRLAVVSSPKAAGYQDFIKHVHENFYGYDVRIDLFESAMQGLQVEMEVMNALDQIDRRKEDYDAVAIIRGGGGRTELAAFDNLTLAVRIAHFPLPVLIGIGHDIDQSVLDLVSYASLKTPTAVADFIIERNVGVEAQLDDFEHRIRQEVYDRLLGEERRITTLQYSLMKAVQSRTVLEASRLQHVRAILRQGISGMIRKQDQRLDFTDTLVSALDPDKVLARGYTITSAGGKAMTHAAELQPGMTIQTTFIDGTVKSKIK